MTTIPTATPIATVRVVKGALEEAELAALVAALHVLSRSAPASAPGLAPTLPSRPRRASWTRPRRCSGPAWRAALDN